MVMARNKFALMQGSLSSVLLLLLVNGRACAFLMASPLPPFFQHRGPSFSAVLVDASLLSASQNVETRLFLSSSSSEDETPSKTETTTAPDSNSSSSNSAAAPLSSLVTARLPTSVEDQVRQCVSSLQASSGTRHLIRLLLPVIGSTELDDWPGGARQMMQAASPLVEQIIAGLVPFETNTSSNNIQKVCLDASDGVYAWLAQGLTPADDCVFVLLPTAECYQAIQNLDEQQVGPKRNLILINPQWRRRSDFGGFFGVDEKAVSYMEGYQPTFYLSNFICEGESIRVLHNTEKASGDNDKDEDDVWRVYCRRVLDNGDVDWFLLGSKPVMANKPADWLQQAGNQRDGGRLFDYGQPSYPEIVDMLQNSDNYTPKNPAERAAAAFDFIKDTL